ncbi:hypothetical protein JKF63_01674 [Porcisia hertigi]|uniref:Uncharacterized protein n=1 Tax=Porcisia hertigi TaxID=2761500 RepID=A0A836H559_9TRYP|nr:hypothetical protein JKF63_01674 [Porcisia hertigi]
MNSSVFCRHNRYDDEANNTAYMESESVYVRPYEGSTATDSPWSDCNAYHSHHTVGSGSSKHDSLPMERIVEMTESLQKEQENQEACEKIDTAIKAQRMRQLRNVKWEALKARMSQRGMSMHTVRAYDSDLDSEDDGEEAELESGHTPRSSALNALEPSLSEERAMRRGAFQAVETMPKRFCHFLYNWFMYSVYAFSASALPGMDIHKGADMREYYNRNLS